MGHIRTILVLAFAVGAGAIAGYWYAGRDVIVPVPSLNAAAGADRKILYYRDPSGAPYWSAGPKQDADGRDYLPVYEDQDVSFEPTKKPPTAGGPRRVLYYRNPMGLPDTSPVPKKDWMGMDYIPVYEGEEQDDADIVEVSLDKIQRSGVRTEAVESRVIARPVRAVGTVMHDESRLTIVAMRSDGFIEDLFVGKTGQHVHAGEPLFRVYSPDIVRAQIDLSNLARSGGFGGSAADKERSIQITMHQLRNLA